MAWLPRVRDYVYTRSAILAGTPPPRRKLAGEEAVITRALPHGRAVTPTDDLNLIPWEYQCSGTGTVTPQSVPMSAPRRQGKSTCSHTRPK